MADRRTGLAYVNGTSAAWTWDSDSRVTDLNHTTSGGTLQAWHYNYTNAGDPLAQNDLTPSYTAMGEAYANTTRCTESTATNGAS